MTHEKTAGARPGAAPRPGAENDAAAGDGRYTLYGALVIAIVALDQATKVIAQNNLRLYDPVPVIGEWFRLTYIYNPGAAFGIHMGEWSRVGFSVLAVVAVIILFTMLRTAQPGDRLRVFAVSMVTAGAIGNVIDRLRSPRGVIDFLDVGVPGGPRWPVFNVADIGVTVGALLLAWSLWREEQGLRQETDAAD